MAKIILKQPGDPSLKKVTKPKSLIYLKWLKISTLLNILQSLAIVYILRKEKIDPVVLSLIEKIKSHL
jgi:hypothetical protein